MLPTFSESESRCGIGGGEGARSTIVLFLSSDLVVLEVGGNGSCTFKSSDFVTLGERFTNVTATAL